jgi:hypothetical protein
LLLGTEPSSLLHDCGDRFGLEFEFGLISTRKAQRR